MKKQLLPIAIVWLFINALGFSQETPKAQVDIHATNAKDALQIYDENNEVKFVVNKQGVVYLKGIKLANVTAYQGMIAVSELTGKLMTYDNGFWITLIQNIPVESVNGKTGDVVLSYSDVGAEKAFVKKEAFNLDFGDISGTVKEGSWTPTWDEVKEKPLQFPPSAHNHTDYVPLENGFDVNTGATLSKTPGSIAHQSNSGETFGGLLPSSYGASWLFNSSAGRDFALYIDKNSTDFYLGLDNSSSGAFEFNKLFHSGNFDPSIYEPKIGLKNNAFNKSFGKIPGSVAEGNHTHKAEDIIDLPSPSDYESKYVNVTGDTMTGDLKVNATGTFGTGSTYALKLQSSSGSRGIGLYDKDNLFRGAFDWNGSDILFRNDKDENLFKLNFSNGLASFLGRGEFGNDGIRLTGSSNKGLLGNSNDSRTLIGGGSSWAMNSGSYVSFEGIDFGGVGNGGNIRFSLPSNKNLYAGAYKMYHEGNLRNNIENDGRYLYRNISNNDVTASIQINDGYSFVVGSSNGSSLSHAGGNTLFDLRTGNFYIRDGSTNRFSFGRTTGDFMATGGATIKKNLVVNGYGVFNGGGNNVRLYGSNTGIANVGYYSIHEKDGKRQGYLGFGSSTSNSLIIHNDVNNANVQIASGSNGLQYGYGSGLKTVWHDGNDGRDSGLDADKTDGYHASEASGGSTLAARNSAGDIFARLFRSEYTSTNPTPNYIMTQIEVGNGNNFIRPTTPAQFRAAVMDGSYVNLNSRTDAGYAWIRRSAGAGSAPFYLTQQGTGDIARFYQGAGDGNLKAKIENDGTFQSNGGLNILGLSILRTVYHRAPNGATFRTDARDEGSAEARLHMYNLNSSGGTSHFRQAWYDGSRYVDVTAFNGGITTNGDLNLRKDNPWISIHSSTSGDNGNEQSGGISIGESGKKGHAAVHLTYTGDGRGHLGMGTVTDGIPTYEVMNMHYQSKNATFLNDISVNGNVLAYGSRYYGDNKSIMQFSDNWLRLNPDNHFTTGIYLGNSLLRTDKEIQLGANGATFKVNNGGTYLNSTIHFNAAINGKIRPHSTNARSTGVYGIYDPSRIGHIWSMGEAFKIPDDGANFGNLYGLAYKHTNNATGGSMAGGHQMVWVTNGLPQAAMGDGGVWTNGTITASGGNSNYWNAAYSWGNHANKYVPLGRTISTGAHLSGGGNLSANRTFSVRPSVNQWFIDSEGKERMYFYSTNTAGGGLILRASNTTGQLQYRNSGNTTVFSVSNDGTIRANGDVVAGYSSDIRLKDSITPISDPIGKVLKLTGNVYKWTDKQDTYTPGEIDYGVIAQEVKEVLPEAARIRPSTGYYEVDYKDLIPLLIEAIKAQQKEIERLKALEKKYEKGKKQIEAFESELEIIKSKLGL